MKEGKEEDQAGRPSCGPDEGRWRLDEVGALGLEGRGCVEGCCYYKQCSAECPHGSTTHIHVHLSEGLIPPSEISGPKDGCVLHFNGWHHIISLFISVPLPTR